MVITIPFHPALIGAAGLILVFVAIKSLIEIIPL